MAKRHDYKAACWHNDCCLSALQVVTADLREAGGLQSKVQGVDAVCWALGTTAFPSARYRQASLSICCYGATSLLQTETCSGMRRVCLAPTPCITALE